MPAKTKGWLWEMLSHRLGVDQGRTAFIPKTDSSPTIIASVFNVISDQTQKQHLIKTLATGWSCSLPEESEDFVVRVSDSRVGSNNNQLEFQAHLQDGAVEWKLGSAFFSDDGVINASFLEYVSTEHLTGVLDKFSVAVLSNFCIGQGRTARGIKRKLIKSLVKDYIRTKVRFFSIFAVLPLTLQARFRIY